MIKHETGEVMEAHDVIFAADLPFGRGHIGAVNPLQESERSEFAAALRRHTKPITHLRTADCPDERQTIALGDGTTDPSLLEQRIVAQLIGGPVLAVTKAAVGADLAYLRDTRDMRTAYLLTYDLLTGLGYEDGGHQSCGASNLVETSVANEVEVADLFAVLPALTDIDDAATRRFAANRAAKHQRLENGFYGAWTSGWHEGFLADTVPHNFLILKDDPADPLTHGHHGRALYAIKTPGMGFAKNAFIRTTGNEAFSTSVGLADQLANDIITAVGGSEEERGRLRLELAVDPAQVLNNLVVENFATFVEAA